MANSIKNPEVWLWCLFLSDHSSFPNCLSFSKYHLYFHFLKYYSQCSNLPFLCNSLEFTDSRIFHLKLKLYPFCTLKSLGPPVLLHSWLNSTVRHTDEILRCPFESGSFPLSVHSDFMHIEHVLDCNDMLIFPCRRIYIHGLLTDTWQCLTWLLSIIL